MNTLIADSYEHSINLNIILHFKFDFNIHAFFWLHWQNSNIGILHRTQFKSHQSMPFFVIIITNMHVFKIFQMKSTPCTKISIFLIFDWIADWNIINFNNNNTSHLLPTKIKSWERKRHHYNNHSSPLPKSSCKEYFHQKYR